MSSYRSMSETYQNPEFRTRAEMCTREQGYLAAAGDKADAAALGRGVVAGDWTDIDAVLAAAVTAPEPGDLLDDEVLRDRVRAVWPVVAAARYPGPA